MRITILFGGLSKERLVSVATAQALHSALPDADLWFWDVDGSVHGASPEALLGHTRPFEEPFKALRLLDDVDAVMAKLRPSIATQVYDEATVRTFVERAIFC